MKKVDATVIITAKALYNNETVASCSPYGINVRHNFNEPLDFPLLFPSNVTLGNSRKDTIKKLKQEWQKWRQKSSKKRRTFMKENYNKNKNINVIIAQAFNESRLVNFFNRNGLIVLDENDPVGFITDVTPEGFKFKILVSTIYGITNNSGDFLATTRMTDHLHAFEISHTNCLIKCKSPELWRELRAPFVVVNKPI